MMVDEENTPPEPLRGMELGPRGTQVRTPVWHKEVHLEEDQIYWRINRNPSIWSWRMMILTFSLILNGMMRGGCGCIALSKGIVEWTHLMRMFVPSININQMSNWSMGYERMWAITFLKTNARRFGGIWGGGPREFNHGHMLMWLCQMVCMPRSFWG